MWRSGGQRAGRIRRPHAVGLVPLCPPCCGGTCRGSRGRATVWGRSAGARLRAARPPQYTPLSRALTARLSCPHTCPLSCLTLVRTSPSGIVAAQTTSGNATRGALATSGNATRSAEPARKARNTKVTALGRRPPLNAPPFSFFSFIFSFFGDRIEVDCDLA